MAHVRSLPQPRSKLERPVSRATVAALGAMLLLASTSRTDAQVVRIRALEEGGRRPAAGALVSLRDASDRVLAQGLTDAEGRLIIMAPGPGTFRLRIDRIGYAGTTVGPLAVAAGDTLSVSVTAPATRVQLPDLAVAVPTAGECELESSAGEVVALLWAEARKALVGSELSRPRAPWLEVTRYQRSYGPGGAIVDETSSQGRSRGEEPFIAASPERLARVGFHDRDGTAHIFYAPDARVLLSEAFLRQHCFHPVTAPDSAPLVGLAFAPTARHRNRTDVTGTLWLDQETAELRHVEFSYTNVPDQLRSGTERGRIDFVRLPDGRWIVGRWQSRVGYREHGGSVAILTGPDAASPAGASLSGTVFDSLTGAPVSGAVVSAGAEYADTTDAAGRYRIEIPTEGEFLVTAKNQRLELVYGTQVRRATPIVRGQEVSVDFAIPSAATLAATRCRERPVDLDTEGIVVGRIMDDGGASRPGVIVASWDTLTVLRAGYRLRVSEHGISVAIPSGDDGRFQVCGVPGNVPLRLSVRGYEATPQSGTLVKPGEARLLPLTAPSNR